MHDASSNAALRWSTVETLVRIVLQFGVSILLARILSPEEFGTIALLLLFVGLAETLMGAGLVVALIQKQDADHLYESTVFWLNTALGGAFSLILFVCAPLFAALYGLPILEPLSRAISACVLLGALGAVPRAMLVKQLAFDKLAWTTFVATLASGAVALWMAHHGYGVWALAVQMLLMVGLNSVCLWILGGWRPALQFSAQCARQLWAPGRYILAASLLYQVSERLNTLLLGLRFPPAEVGVFGRAQQFSSVPALVVSDAVARVTLASFARHGHAPLTLRAHMREMVQLSAFVIAPVMIGMAAIGGSLIDWLLGPAWMRVTPLMQALCIASVLMPLSSLNINALLAQDQSKRHFRNEVIKRVMMIAALIIGSAFGAIGVALSMLAVAIPCLWVDTRFNARALTYGMTHQLRDSAPAFTAASIMGAVVIGVPNLAPTMSTAGSITLLSAQIACGIMIYGGWALLFRPRGFVALCKIMGRNEDAIAHAKPPPSLPSEAQDG